MESLSYIEGCRGLQYEELVLANPMCILIINLIISQKAVRPLKLLYVCVAKCASRRGVR